MRIEKTLLRRAKRFLVQAVASAGSDRRTIAKNQAEIVAHVVKMQFALRLPRGAPRAELRRALAEKLSSAAQKIREDDFSMNR